MAVRIPKIKNLRSGKVYCDKCSKFVRLGEWVRPDEKCPHCKHRLLGIEPRRPLDGGKPVAGRSPAQKAKAAEIARQSMDES